MPDVSVVIPTYDRPTLLRRAVTSARAAGTNIEIIVVDDASTDDTASVCQELTSIKCIRLERNQGVAGARNVGLLQSEGKYVCFLDDDDLRLPGSLDTQAKALEANPEAGFVCGAVIMADQNLHETGEVIYPRHISGDVFWEILELDLPVMGLSALIRKECLLSTGLLRSKLSGIDDWDIFVRLAELYPVLIFQEPVGVYRKPTPFSGQGSSGRATQLRRVVRHQIQLLKLPRGMSAPSSKRRSVHRRMINRIADTLLWTAAQQLSRGEFGPALTNILVALRLNPLRAIRPGAYGKLVETLRKKNNFRNVS